MSTNLSNLRNSRLVKAKEKLGAAKKKYEDVVAAAQHVCSHPVVMNAKFEEMKFFNGLRPMRICVACGFEEEGWTFMKLNDQPMRVITQAETREDIYRYRT